MPINSLNPEEDQIASMPEPLTPPISPESPPDISPEIFQLGQDALASIKPTETEPQPPTGVSPEIFKLGQDAVSQIKTPENIVSDKSQLLEQALASTKLAETPLETNPMNLLPEDWMGDVTRYTGGIVSSLTPFGLAKQFTPPPGAAGMAGEIVGSVASFAVPSGIATKALSKAPGLVNVLTRLSSIPKYGKFLATATKQLLTTGATFGLQGQIQTPLATSIKDRAKILGESTLQSTLFAGAGVLGSIAGKTGKWLTYPAMFGIGYNTAGNDASPADKFISGAVLTVLHGISSGLPRAEAETEAAKAVKEQYKVNPEKAQELIETVKSTPEYQNVIVNAENKIKPTETPAGLPVEPSKPLAPTDVTPLVPSPAPITEQSAISAGLRPTEKPEAGGRALPLEGKVSVEGKKKTPKLITQKETRDQIEAILTGQDETLREFVRKRGGISAYKNKVESEEWYGVKGKGGIEPSLRAKKGEGMSTDQMAEEAIQAGVLQADPTKNNDQNLRDALLFAPSKNDLIKQEQQQKLAIQSEANEAAWNEKQSVMAKNPNAEKITEPLAEGDTFTMQGEHFKAGKKTNVYGQPGVMVKDGYEFFLPFDLSLQREAIYIDKGSLKKARVAGKGELFPAEDLSLVGQKVTDTERIQRERDIEAKRITTLALQAQELPGVKISVAEPTRTVFNTKFDAIKKTVINPDTGRNYTESDIWKALGDQHFKEGDVEANRNLMGKLESLGAAAARKLEIITKSQAEAGPERLKSLLQTAKESKVITPEAKKAVGEVDPMYESQRTKKMSETVESWLKEDAAPEEVASRVAEAEKLVRDPAEEQDTKGAVMVALIKHYRSVGNDAAQADLIKFADPQLRGAGRYIQAVSMLNELTGNNWIKEMDTYLKLRKVELPEDIRKEIENDFLEAAKLKDEPARKEAVHAAIVKLSTYVPFKSGEWLDAYRYMNMLFNPQSHERNIYGNTIQTLITRPAALLAEGDYRGMKNYLIPAWRSVLSGDAMRVAAKAYHSGDYMKFAESLEKPNASIFDAIRMETGPQGTWKKPAWKVLTAVQRFLNAQDKFFGAMMEAGETTRLLREGHPLEVSQNLSRELYDKFLYRKPLGTYDPTAPTMVRALDEVANILEKARNSRSPLVAWPAKLSVPFLRTPIRIAQFAVESSPLGWIGVKLNNNSVARARYGKQFEKLSESEKLHVTEDIKLRRGLASIGTAVTLVGLGAAMTGRTTWEAPQDPEAKKRFYASGRRPFSFNVPGTNKWVPMAYLGPWFLAFAIPAAARDAFADNPEKVNQSTLNKLYYAAVGIPKIILSQTPVSGIGNLLEALQGRTDSSIAASIGFMGSQFIPGSGLLAWINKIVDPTYRKLITIFESIQSRIPGLSNDLKAYRDVTGIDATRPWTDVYMPYTLGEKNTDEERGFQIRMDYLRFNNEIKEKNREFNAKRSELNQDFDSLRSRKEPIPRSIGRQRMVFNGIEETISIYRKRAQRIIENDKTPDDQKESELQVIMDKITGLAEKAMIQYRGNQ